MNIEEYDTPTDDPYAPRPKASQDVARARLERRHEEPKDEGRRTKDAPGQHQIIAGVFGVVMVVGVFALALSQFSTSGPLVLRPTDAPTATSERAREATSPAFSAPTATPPPDIATIPAYAAPDGLLLGPIETTRKIVPVAHFGTGWIQADVEGSGRIWLRKNDLPGVALVGPDLAPAPPQTGRGMPSAPQLVEVAPPVPTADFYTTSPKVDPTWQQSLIGSDPNALACNGSVWCGGLTNAEAQAALDAQRATAAAARP